VLEGLTIAIDMADCPRIGFRDSGRPDLSQPNESVELLRNEDQFPQLGFVRFIFEASGVKKQEPEGLLVRGGDLIVQRSIK
jgi:hypothetical protein